mmetsp:Transcript_26463/g.36874  ORF Transcript_26463/g.36874 Transcript_26463/m.36874 type:complete len:304 (-) Transcript_26463:277-1188(-)
MRLRYSLEDWHVNFRMTRFAPSLKRKLVQLRTSFARRRAHSHLSDLGQPVNKQKLCEWMGRIWVEVAFVCNRRVVHHLPLRMSGRGALNAVASILEAPLAVAMTLAAPHAVAMILAAPHAVAKFHTPLLDAVTTRAAPHTGAMTLAVPHVVAVTPVPRHDVATTPVVPLVVVLVRPAAPLPVVVVVSPAAPLPVVVDTTPPPAVPHVDAGNVPAVTAAAAAVTRAPPRAVARTPGSARVATLHDVTTAPAVTPTPRQSVVGGAAPKGEGGGFFGGLYFFGVYYEGKYEKENEGVQKGNDGEMY